MSITKREKILIAVAVVAVVLFFAGNFLILPAFKTYAETKEQYDQLIMDKQMVELKLANEESARADFERIEKLYQENEDIFVDFLTNEELDRLITGLCLENGLKPTTLGMTVTKKPTPAEQSSSSSQAESEVDDRVTGNKATDEAVASIAEATGETSLVPETEIVEIPPVVLAATVSVAVSGEYERLQQLIDSVNQTTYIRIQSMSYTFFDPAKAADTAQQNPPIQIVFLVYMKNMEQL